MFCSQADTNLDPISWTKDLLDIEVYEIRDRQQMNFVTVSPSDFVR